MDADSLRKTANAIGYFIAIVFECALIAVIGLVFLAGLAWAYFESRNLLEDWIAKKNRIRAKKAKEKKRAASNLEQD